MGKAIASLFGDINDWIAQKNLDMRTDILISNVCGFSPLYVAPSLKRDFENRLGANIKIIRMINYSDAHFALVKLCLYAETIRADSQKGVQLEEVKRGIQALCCRDDIPSEAILRALRHLNDDADSDRV